MGFGRYKSAILVAGGVAAGSLAAAYAPEIKSTFTGWRKVVQGWRGPEGSTTESFWTRLFGKAKTAAKTAIAAKTSATGTVPQGAAQPLGFFERIMHFLFGL
jgi:hypothetical protein